MNITFKQVNVFGEHRSKYLELHNHLFKGAAITLEWLNWYHSDISVSHTWSSGTRTWGAFDDDKLIGVWSVEPKTLNGMKVGRCFAVGIHEDYRRNNLFVLLSKFAIEEERKIGEYEYILGFPQKGRSVVGGHLKAGWYKVFDIDIYSRNNTLNYSYQSKNVVDFTTTFDGIISAEGFDRDELYLHTRWTNHPDHQYLSYRLGNSFVVLKPYGKCCHIVDMSGNIDDIESLLKTTIMLSRKHGWEELNLWAAGGSKYIAVLESLQFSNGASYGLPIELLAVNINAPTELKLETAPFQMGVEEGY